MPKVNMKNKEKLLFVWVMLAAVNTFGGNPKWEIGVRAECR